MKTINFDTTKIPVVGYGTWPLRGKSCFEAVSIALSEGYRSIDTAEGYGNEESVGNAINSSNVPREQIFLTTKGSDAGALVTGLEGSLQRLRTDYVDLFLLHSPSLRVPLSLIFESFNRILKSGNARYIGLSNFTPGMLDKISQFGIPIANLQNEFNPLANQPEVLQQGKRLGAFFTASRPLAKGKIVDNPVLCSIAAKYQKTPAQIALKWAIDKGNVAVIPNSRSKARMIENLKIFDIRLDVEDTRKIDSLNQLFSGPNFF